MPQRLRTRILLLAAVALAVASGCSIRRLAYRFAPSLVMSAVDDAVGMTKAQKEWLRPQIATTLAWHRREELPRYIATIDELRGRLASGLKEEDAHWARDAMRNAFMRAAGQIVPVASEFLVTLSPPQIDHLEKSAGKQRHERDKEMELPVDKYVAKQGKIMTRQAEKWLGSTLPAQRAAIDDYLRRTRPDILASRQLQAEQSSDFFKLLRTRPSAGELSGMLIGLALRNATGASRDVNARLQGENEKLLADLFHLATPAQRKHLDVELVSLRSDLEAMSKDGS